MQNLATLLGVLTPLFAVPLTVVLFYLRSLREQQTTWHGELMRRLAATETGTTELRRMLGEFARDYTTKEEWLRECVSHRRLLEKLHEAAVRLETRLEIRDVPAQSAVRTHRHHSRRGASGETVSSDSCKDGL